MLDTTQPGSAGNAPQEDPIGLAAARVQNAIVGYINSHVTEKRQLLNVAMQRCVTYGEAKAKEVMLPMQIVTKGMPA